VERRSGGGSGVRRQPRPSSGRVGVEVEDIGSVDAGQCIERTGTVLGPCAGLHPPHTRPSGRRHWLLRNAAVRRGEMVLSMLPVVVPRVSRRARRLPSRVRLCEATSADRVSPTPPGSHAPVNSHATITEPMSSTTLPDLLPSAVRDAPATAKLVSLAPEGRPGDCRDAGAGNRTVPAVGRAGAVRAGGPGPGRPPAGPNGPAPPIVGVADV
jgi:hypothetical protein